MRLQVIPHRFRIDQQDSAVADRRRRVLVRTVCKDRRQAHQLSGVGYSQQQLSVA